MRILIIRFSSLGDVVLTSALLPNIKKKWPESEVTILTKPPFAPVFDGNPNVDSVRLYDPEKQPYSQLTKEIRNEDFDILIDLQNNLRSWFIRFISGVPVTVAVEKRNLARRKLVWLKMKSKSLKKSVLDRSLDCLERIDVPIVSKDTEVYPDKKFDVANRFSIDTSKKLIGIAPGAMHATKRWTVEGFAEAANRLGAMTDTQIVILGDKKDKEIALEVSKNIKAPCVNLAGWTSLTELIAVVSKLNFLLTNDSGILHIAEALKIPLVALFGPTVRDFGFAPYRNSSRVVEVTNLKCRPCSLHGDEYCPLKHHKCMKDLDVNAVLLASSMLLDKVDEFEDSMPRCGQ